MWGCKQESNFIYYSTLWGRRGKNGEVGGKDTRRVTKDPNIYPWDLSNLLEFKVLSVLKLYIGV